MLNLIKVFIAISLVSFYVEQELNFEKLISPSIIGIVDSFEIQPQQGVKNEFEGKLFLLGQGFGETPCVIERGCDCCNSKLLFISSNAFILNELCEGSESVTKGKYKVEEKTLTLIYDPLIVNYNYNWEREVNPKAVEFTFEIIKKPIPFTKFQIEKCNGQTIIALRTKQGDELGKFDATATNAGKIKELKEKGIWQKLEIKP